MCPSSNTCTERLMGGKGSEVSVPPGGEGMAEQRPLWWALWRLFPWMRLEPSRERVEGRARLQFTQIVAASASWFLFGWLVFFFGRVSM